MLDWFSQTYQILKTVDFAETETQSPIKQKFLQSNKFPTYPGGYEVSSRKHERRVFALQERVKLPITVATRAKSNCRFLQMTSRISPNSIKPSAFWSRRLSRPAKPDTRTKPRTKLLGTDEFCVKRGLS